jgi:hypothetical protein
MVISGVKEKNRGMQKVDLLNLLGVLYTTSPMKRATLTQQAKQRNFALLTPPPPTHTYCSQSPCSDQITPKRVLEVGTKNPKLINFSNFSVCIS